MELRLNELLLAIIETNKAHNVGQDDKNGLTSTLQYQQLKTMSIKIKNTIQELAMIEKANRNRQAKSLYENFFKTLGIVAEDVKKRQKRYKDLDKEKLVDDKCLKIAKNINSYRDECAHLRKKIKQRKKQLLIAKSENEAIRIENAGSAWLKTKKQFEKNYYKEQVKSSLNNTSYHIQKSQPEQQINKKYSHAKKFTKEQLKKNFLQEKATNSCNKYPQPTNQFVRSLNSLKKSKKNPTTTAYSIELETDLAGGDHEPERYYLYSRNSLRNKRSHEMNSRRVRGLSSHRNLSGKSRGY